MKLIIGESCTGFGVCEGIRPDLLEVGDDGYVHLQAEVSEEDRADLEYIVSQCPTQALSLED